MGSTLQGRAEWLRRRGLPVLVRLLRNAAASYRFVAGVQAVVSVQASCGRESAGAAISVARAFQPELRPLAFVASGDRRKGAGALQAVGVTRSREAAKPRIETQRVSGR